MAEIENWDTLSTSEHKSLINDLTSGKLNQTELFSFLNIVRAKGHYGVYASTGPRFRHAIFGRDALTVANDLIEYCPGLVKEILITLARLQGKTVNHQSEEEPGKIPHEYRTNNFNGFEIPKESLDIFHELQHLWGGEGTSHMLYYGSFDATPLFIRTLSLYVKYYGPDILGEQVDHIGGEVHTLADSVKAALDWLVNKIKSSPSGLLEYKRLNPNGLQNQAWKDSYTGYLFADNSLPNFDGGIASAELQAYAYDALTNAAHFLELDSEQARQLTILAEQVRSLTLEKLWMPDQAYFAQGLDHNPADNSDRQINTLTSNGALLLDSSILEGQDHKYAEGIIKMITSSEFATEVGIRCRAHKHSGLLDQIDYHGSYTVWPKETYSIARGLKRFGEAETAKRLEDQILNGVSKSGEFYEFFYVKTDGSVCYDASQAKAFFGIPEDVFIPVPEPGQAWTISAVLAIAATRQQHSTSAPAYPAAA